jgi:hypothetical protein
VGQQEQQHATDQVQMGMRGPGRELCWMPMTMPASIPTSKTTTLWRIISDPVIHLSLLRLAGLKSRSGEPGAHALSPSL